MYNPVNNGDKRMNYLSTCAGFRRSTVSILFVTWSGSLDFFISAQEKKTAKLKANVCVVTQEVLTCWLCHCCSWQKSFFVSKFLQQNVKNFKNCDLGKFLKQTIGNYQLKKMCWNMTFFFKWSLCRLTDADAHHYMKPSFFCASTRRFVDLTVWPRYEKNTGHSNEVLQAPLPTFVGEERSTAETVA